MKNIKIRSDTVIPIIVGTNGRVSKSFTKYLSNIPSKYQIKALQNTAICGTAHVLREVLM
jgi:hypothetical protein